MYKKINMVVSTAVFPLKHIMADQLILDYF